MSENNDYLIIMNENGEKKEKNRNNIYYRQRPWRNNRSVYQNRPSLLWSKRQTTEIILIHGLS